MQYAHRVLYDGETKKKDQEMSLDVSWALCKCVFYILYFIYSTNRYFYI